MASKNVGIDLAPVMMRLQSIPAELPAIKVAIKAAKEMPIQLPTEDSTTDSSYGPGIAEAVRADKEVAMAELERAKEGCVLVHPDQDTIRLKIPTLHVLGRNDDAYQAGRKLRDLCDARYASIMEHTEGHNVPRGETEKLKDLIEKTVARSEFLF